MLQVSYFLVFISHSSTPVHTASQQPCSLFKVMDMSWTPQSLLECMAFVLICLQSVVTSAHNFFSFTKYLWIFLMRDNWKLRCTCQFVAYKMNFLTKTHDNNASKNLWDSLWRFMWQIYLMSLQQNQIFKPLYVNHSFHNAESLLP